MPALWQGITNTGHSNVPVAALANRQGQQPSQAGDESWKAMGDQLIAEEEQVAARAAAKRTRKQKQRAQKQSTKAASMTANGQSKSALCIKGNASDTQQADSVLNTEHAIPQCSSPELAAVSCEIVEPSNPSTSDRIRHVSTPIPAPPSYSYSAAELSSFRHCASCCSALSMADIPGILLATSAAASSSVKTLDSGVPSYSSAGHAPPTQLSHYRGGTNFAEANSGGRFGNGRTADQIDAKMTEPARLIRAEAEHSALTPVTAATTSATAEEIAMENSSIDSVSYQQCSKAATAPDFYISNLQALLCCPLTKVSLLLQLC